MSYAEDDPLNAILNNVKSLLECAKSLHRAKRYAVSSHISILCAEEASKYLIVYCKAHLPAEVFKNRYKHINKHLVASAPWYLSGKLHVLYIFYLASRMLSPRDKGSKELSVLSDYLSVYFLRNDPEAIAESILGVLNPQDEKIRALHKESNDEREKSRLSSVYVDLSDDLKIVSGPANFDRKKSKLYLDQALFCLSVVNFISKPTETIVEFVNMLPAGERRRFQREARRDALKLAKVKDAIS